MNCAPMKFTIFQFLMYQIVTYVNFFKTCFHSWARENLDSKMNMFHHGVLTFSLYRNVFSNPNASFFVLHHIHLLFVRPSSRFIKRCWSWPVVTWITSIVWKKPRLLCRQFRQLLAFAGCKLFNCKESNAASFMFRTLWRKLLDYCQNCSSFVHKATQTFLCSVFL